MLWTTQLSSAICRAWAGTFYLPVILFVALIAMAVPVWAAIGSRRHHHVAYVGGPPAKPCW